MKRIATLAGGIAAGVATLGGGVPATASTALDERPPRALLLEDGGRTPVARPGSALAARSAISRSRLRARLDRQMDRVGSGSGAWVFDVTDPPGGGFLFSDSGDRRRILASNTKLFTTAAYLGRFGPDDRLRTSVWARGGRAGRRDQVLRGGLALVGDGDPALASSTFANRHNLPVTRLRPLAEAVRRAGIRKVRNGVRADPTIFDGKRSVPQPGITGGPFLGPLSGLSYNSGLGATGYASSPAREAARAFIRKLRQAGVDVRGGISVGDTRSALRRREPIATVRSPAAARLIAETNTPSDNFFAEMLLKRLAATHKRPGTTARGARKAERFARRAGGGVEMVNGSGLSRSNVASPRGVGKLLVHMARSDRLQRAFRSSLAIAGRTGTLSDRMRGTAAEGRCRAKTGTIDGVSALSGYCRAGTGLVAFSILMNGVGMDHARRVQDAMAALIARYR